MFTAELNFRIPQGSAGRVVIGWKDASNYSLIEIKLGLTTETESTDNLSEGASLTNCYSKPELHLSGPPPEGFSRTHP